MEVGRKIVLLLALALAHCDVFADIHQASADFCRNQNMAGRGDCHVQPCPCDPSSSRLKRFDDPSDGLSLCACSSRLNTMRISRQLAMDACDAYRLTHHQPCFISRGDCPEGFEALQTYSGESDSNFTACRDRRHERPNRKPDYLSDLRNMTSEELMNQYGRLVSALENGSRGKPRALQAESIDRLAPYFHGFPLEQISFIKTTAISHGCFTDCNRVFCATTEPVDAWTRASDPLISRTLLHQIVHAESCERGGGREWFVSNWLRYLPDEVHAKILTGKPVDADSVHAAIYMERFTEARAVNLCRSINGCSME